MHMITGGSGFLGARLKEYLTKRNHKVVAPSHKELDLLDADAVMEYMKKKMPKYVFHCAAISDTGYCQKHEEESYAMNVQVVENIAKACKEVGAKLIFCSSDQVYYNLPDNIYGYHKLLAEQICTKYLEDAVCLRLTWMYDTKKLCEREHGNFYLTVKENLEQGNVCTFPTHDHRGITNVWSVIENMEKAKDLPGGSYDFGAENQDTTYETVRKLFDAKGISQDMLVPNEEAFRDKPRDISLNIEKIRRYGIDFEDTINALIKVEL